jgi:hypothetical protein
VAKTSFGHVPSIWKSKKRVIKLILSVFTIFYGPSVNVKLCIASIVYWCEKLILHIFFSQFVELGKNLLFYAAAVLNWTLQRMAKWSPTQNLDPGDTFVQKKFL